MKKFILALLPMLLFSAQPDTALQKIHAKLYPKIIFFDQDYRSKLIQNQILFTIAYCEGGKREAEHFQQVLEEHYPRSINGIPFQSNLIESRKITPHLQTTALYYTCGCQAASQSVQTLQKLGRITFACEFEQLDQGVMVGLSITKNVKPVINKNALRENPIQFESTFTRISEIYDEN